MLWNQTFQFSQQQNNQTIQPKFILTKQNNDYEYLQKIVPKQEPPICTYPYTFERKENKTVRTIRNKIKYSSKKLNCLLVAIRKRHVLDAMNVCYSSKKKGARILIYHLRQIIHFAAFKNISIERLFVKEAIVGKALGPKQIDIKARGRFGIIRPPITSLRLVAEEISDEQFVKKIYTGTFPVALGEQIKQHVFSTQGNIEQIQRYSGLTSNRGRFYRKQQFKRLIQLIQKEYQKKGINMKQDKIERYILQKKVEEYQMIKEKELEQNFIVQKNLRQQAFDENYKEI